MLKFSKKIKRLRDLPKGLFKRGDTKLLNQEDAGSIKHGEGLIIPTLGLQEAPVAGNGRMAEELSMRPHEGDRELVCVDGNEQHGPSSPPPWNTGGTGTALGIHLEGDQPTTQEPLMPDVRTPELEMDHLRALPNSIGTSALSPISEEPAAGVSKSGATRNPIKGDFQGQGVEVGGDHHDRLSPLDFREDKSTRREVPRRNDTPLEKWVANVARHTALERARNEGALESGQDRSGVGLAPSERSVDTGTDDPQKLLKHLDKKVIEGPAFGGAHDFVINNPIFLDSLRSTTKTMKLLYRKALPSTSLDSDARSPVPVCLTGTRTEVRTRILTWVADRNRISNLLWLYGPAGVGTTAVAQTVAEYCKARGWLGAAFFFPRMNQHKERTRVIPSLAYQLATTSPAYRNYITSLLDHDRSILEGSLYAQFQKLVAEPLSTIIVSTVDPVLILLDGLNHFKDNRFHRELIECIGKFSAKANRSGFPFVWIISSRREQHILSSFETADPPIVYQREELRIDTQDAEQDVSRFIHYGLQKIGHAFHYTALDGNSWPKQDHLSTISSTSSGLFAFASSILDFIDSDNPVEKLQECLEFLKHNTIPKSGNPLQPLHFIYQDILDDIPLDTLPLTKRILSFLALGAQEIPAQVAAEFLSLNRAAFYGGVLRLYSVLEVPTPIEGVKYPLFILHPSMRDFIKGKITSGDFELDVRGTAPGTAANIEERCLERYIQWKTKGLCGILPSPWYCTDAERNIMQFLMREMWAIWSNKDEEEVSKIRTTLLKFDFSEYNHVDGKLERLAPLKHVERQVTRFLHVLSNWQEKSGPSSYPIVRSEPTCQTDEQLFKEYQHLITHPRMKKFDFYRLKPVSEPWRYKMFSVNPGRSGPSECPNMLQVLSDSHPVYFLLGYDNRTCLVIAYS